MAGPVGRSRRFPIRVPLGWRRRLGDGGGDGGDEVETEERRGETKTRRGFDFDSLGCRRWQRGGDRDETSQPAECCQK